MTAHKILEITAWSTCSTAAIITVMLLSPGITEIRDRVKGVTRRVRRKRSQGARHRLATASQKTDPHPGHRVQDPGGKEAAA